jgi:hypothetical protein
MAYYKLKKSFKIPLILSVILATTNNFAQSPMEDTIANTSIKWEDIANRTLLLKNAPNWDEKTIGALFDAYQHPDRYQLGSSKNFNQYNAQFIHAFWGPLNSPFNKYPRPVKAFVIVKEKAVNADHFYMAPLIKNSVDGNDYIFDKEQTQPILLSDWITHIQSKHGHQASIQFNICNAYANSIYDSCTNRSYQEEARDTKTALKESMPINIPSAHRGFYEHWQTKIRKMHPFSNEIQDSIYHSSIAWKNIDARNQLLHTIETWPNYTVIKTNFEKLRDIRYFRDESNPNFLRRISWLYPDDGCWTRAAAVIKDLFGPFKNPVNNYARPTKIFAFGNLCVNSSNAPEGMVTWWYHTAPVIRDAETNQSYVLDPAVNPYKPMPTEQWMEAISSQSGACSGSGGNISTFNVCNGYGVGPYDICQNPRITFANETNAMFGQSTYRYYERSRQLELGRDANKVLGDLPPWIDSVS